MTREEIAAALEEAFRGAFDHLDKPPAALEELTDRLLEDINDQLVLMGAPYTAAVDPEDPERILLVDNRPPRIRLTLRIE